MAFINEEISPENIEKYDIAAIDRKFFKAHYKPEWTVDHTRNMYLRWMTPDRELHYDNFSFLWKGTLLHLRLQRHLEGDGKVGSELTSTWTIFPFLGHKELMLPDELNQDRAEILSALKEALIVFNKNGLKSNQYKHTIRFEFYADCAECGVRSNITTS